jgi:hypothetical protein
MNTTTATSVGTTEVVSVSADGTVNNNTAAESKPEVFTIELPVEFARIANSVCMAQKRNKNIDKVEMLVETITQSLLAPYKAVSKDIESIERTRYFQNIADGWKSELTIEQHLENKLREVKSNLAMLEDKIEYYKEHRRK